MSCSTPLFPPSTSSDFANLTKNTLACADIIRSTSHRLGTIASTSGQTDRTTSTHASPTSTLESIALLAFNHPHLQFIEWHRFHDSGAKFTIEEFCERRHRHKASHEQQRLDTALSLRQQYEHRRFSSNSIPVLDLVRLLHFTVDNSDQHLYYTSQLVHTAQVILAVEKAEQSAMRRHQQHGTQPQDSLLGAHAVSALLHDLGKLLSLHNEPPTNVDSGNWFLCEPSAGVGFEFTFHHPTI